MGGGWGGGGGCDEKELVPRGIEKLNQPRSRCKAGGYSVKSVMQQGQKVVRR